MERWEQVESLFHDALRRAAAERDAWLKEACHGDCWLHREVASLIANHQEANDFEPWAAVAAAKLIDEPISLHVGQRLGPYEILAPIGVGGMGEVWKARDTRLERIVAIKISLEQFSERSEREAHAVAALNHPHICQLYDVGPNYLVMEFVDGVPLEGPLPLEKAVEYSGQTLDALDAAHRKGITHRDLKPANILVTKRGIKLLDFGLAKQSAPLHQAAVSLPRRLTSQGQILGTLQYMSPEQLQGKEADARSDLFAFGCVLSEMLTGKRVFEGQSAASVVAAILEREPAPLTVAPALERIVRRSLAKDPDQRFQTARDLKAALTWALAQPPPSAAAKPDRQWKWIGAASLAIGILLGGWTVSHFRQPSAQDRVFRLQIDPPENGRFVFGANSGGIALSPDGRTAAYVASSNGKNGLWVRPLDGTAARLIAGTEGAAHPFWSPDGRFVAFFSGNKLQRVDLAGGSPLVICDAASARGGAWSADGHILFGTTVSGLFQVPASGGTPSPLTTLDASRREGSHRWPQVLSGGSFLYFASSMEPENNGVYASSLVNPREGVRLLTTETGAVYAPGARGKSYLLWMRGTTLVAQEFNPAAIKFTGEPHPVADPVAKIAALGQMHVAASASGVLLYSTSNMARQFTWLDRTGKPLGTMGEPSEYGTFRLSPDGRRVATSRDRPTKATDLWLLDVARGGITRFTSTPQINMFPVFSPDGRMIAFSSSFSRNLFCKESSGAGTEERLTQSPNVQFPTDWSRDGRWILYYEYTPGAGVDLLVLPVKPGGKGTPEAMPKPYIRTPFNEKEGRFSPESPPRWVAYQSDVTGRYEVYIQAFPEPRGKFQISTDGGQYPQWAAGGRGLFYVSLDNKLMAVNLKMGTESVKASTPRELFPLPVVDIGLSPYESSADGRRFLVRATLAQAGQPLTIIVNWPALLTK